jgi:4-amino-4-deoxy-L-arabinose transferase-like glycosyltransferase
VAGLGVVVEHPAVGVESNHQVLLSRSRYALASRRVNALGFHVKRGGPLWFNRGMTTPRREALAIAILTVIGATLRLWGFGRLGLSHFDEGIYAIAGLWSSDSAGLGAFDPQVLPYYAPPGYPILVGIGYLVLPWGISDLSAIVMAELCAIATIPVVAWIGRRTYGPGAGAAAAALAAWSGQHVAFSRMAMTDAPFLLAWLVALGLGGRFLEKPTIGRAVALGVAVGAAMNLKYNGWLAGVIVVLTALIVPDKGRGRTLGLLAIAAGVAAALYLPWFLFVNRHDGYAALLQHQRSYAGGLATWLPHLLTQLDQSVSLSGGLPILGGWPRFATGLFLAAWAVLAISAWRGQQATDRERRRSTSWLVLYGGIVVLAVLPAVLWCLALMWVVSIQDAEPSRRLQAVAWVVLTILTPFYHPYARLWLPVLAAGWIVVGGTAALLLNGELDLVAEGKRMGRPRSVLFVAAAAVLLLALSGSLGPFRVRPGLFRATDGLRVAVSTELAPRLRRDGRDPLVVLARPSVLFYLAPATDRSIRRLPDLDTIDRLDDASRWALLDVALLAQEASFPRGSDEPQEVISRLAALGWVDRLRVAAPAALPTLLDIELGNATIRENVAEPTDLLLFERPPR